MNSAKLSSEQFVACSAKTPGETESVVPDAGMFDLARIEAPPAGWALAIPPALVAWLGSLAFFGQFRANDVSSALGQLCPLRTLFLGSGIICLVAIGMDLGRRNYRRVQLWSAVAGYLAGHELFARLPVHSANSWRIPFQSLSDGLAFSGQRLIYGLCVVGLSLGGLWVSSRWTGHKPVFYFRIGNWRAWGRDFTHRSKPETYIQSFFGFLVFAVILFIVVQMSVELKPLRAGTLWGLLPALGVAALANALVEELIYRGVLQTAFVEAAGLARGIWICSLMFGLLHWGQSVGVLAALPVSILIGVGAVFWGKSLRDTGGISWAILAHSLVDLMIMSAYFVPSSAS